MHLYSTFFFSPEVATTENLASRKIHHKFELTFCIGVVICHFALFYVEKYKLQQKTILEVPRLFTLDSVNAALFINLLIILA